MPTCCFVPGCSTRGGHNFPTDENKRKAWVRAINRKESDKKGKAWIPSNSSVVCRRHFLPSDYKEKKMTTGLSHPGLEEIPSPVGGQGSGLILMNTSCKQNKKKTTVLDYDKCFPLDVDYDVTSWFPSGYKNFC